MPKSEPPTNSNMGPDAKPSAKPEGAAFTRMEAIEKQLADAVPALGAAQEELRRAKQRLATFDEALKKQNLPRLQALLGEDLETAKAERNKEFFNVLKGVPGFLGTVGEAFKGSPVLGAGTAAAVGVSVYDIAEGVLSTKEAWEKVQTKAEKGESPALSDYGAAVAGVAKLAVSVANAPGAPWNRGEFLETAASRVAYPVLVADTLFNSSVALASEYRYLNVMSSTGDLNGAALHQQRLQIEVQKAEMRERQLRGQANRWRDALNREQVK